MNYPGGLTKNYNKTINYSNRGLDLEDLINISNKYYLEIDKAVIYKKPTPIQIVESKFTANGREITKAFFSEPSTLDYNGIYKGKYIDFDAKVTKNKTSFPLENLHPHQYNHIERVIRHGGISFLIIRMNDKYYYLDGNDIINFINNNTRKSIPFSYIEDKGYVIKEKIQPRLDYLEVIDKLYFGGENNGKEEK